MCCPAAPAGAAGAGHEGAVISTLAELVAPLAEEEFIALLRAPKPRLLRGTQPDRFAPLLDWDGFMAAMRSGAVPSKKLRLTQRAKALPPIFYSQGGVLTPGALERVFGAGGSVVAFGVEPHLPAFQALCAHIAARLGERIALGVIATAGAGGALPPHFDDGDILIVQIEGAKRWFIEADPMINPSPGRRWPARADARELVLDETLSAGDLLFLPAGYRHRCENLEARSLHASIFMFPLTALRALELIAERLARSPERRAPLRFAPGAAGEVEAALKATLAQAVEDATLADLVAEHIATDPFHLDPRASD
jgi:hypothetical protein